MPPLVVLQQMAAEYAAHVRLFASLRGLGMSIVTPVVLVEMTLVDISCWRMLIAENSICTWVEFDSIHNFDNNMPN